MPEPTKSEMLLLKERLAAAEQQLFENSRNAYEAAEATRRAAQEASERQALQAAEAARQEQIEQQRRGAWTEHHIKALPGEGLQAFSDANMTRLTENVDREMKAEGSWPPGIQAADFAIALAPNHIQSGEAAQTSMGRMIAERRAHLQAMAKID